MSQENAAEPPKPPNLSAGATLIRVALIDDHTVVRYGLRTFLESYSDIQVVGEADSGEAALAQIEQWLPDVALMDILMPGGLDGIETTRRLRTMTPHTQVVVLTSYTDDARVVAALRAGAIGYVRKDAEPAALLAAIRAAARGQSALEPVVAAALARELAQGEPKAGSQGAKGIVGDQQLEDAALTPREYEVLRLLALGYTNREIAEQLVVSGETVKTHVGNILTKLHFAHRVQAAMYALKCGLVPFDDFH